MGGTTSSLYNHCRRIILRYNVENRAEKFLEKGQSFAAPRHPLPDRFSKQGFALSDQQRQELHGKNEQLNEYLKKVYLTSTSKVIGTPSKRPKPKKENERLKVTLFYEPQTASPGHCTLTNVVDILLKFQEDSDTWNASGIARQYNLDKKDVVQLLMYHSLFTVEKFEFMNATPTENKEEQEKIEFEVYKQLEKKPVKQIEGKKEDVNLIKW